MQDSLSDSSTSSGNRKVKKRVRKRLRKPDTWQRNKIKELKNSGKAYTDWKGKKRSEKKMKATCQNCRLKCSEQVNEEQRNNNF